MPFSLKIYAFAVAIFCAGICLCQVSVTQAHFLETDGQIGSVLHIDPNDAPVANQPATFFFDITDRTGHFQLENCACQITVSQNGSPVTAGDASANSSTQASFAYQFSRPGVYQVELHGKPAVPNTFQAFGLHWDIRVEAGQNPGNPDTTWAWLALALGVVAVFWLYSKHRFIRK